MIKRRDFLKRLLHITGGISFAGLVGPGILRSQATSVYKISLAEWSLHRALFANEIDHLDFARIAKQEYGIDAVEYVNQFFMDKATDQQYLQEMKNRAENEGVQSRLIMCDLEGNLGDPDEQARTQAVENHYKWVEAAKFLGCESIRVNARSAGSYEEQMEYAADGLSRLTEYAEDYEINVIVENHGGLSSNGEWLTGVMDMVDNPRCGTLPDFGNFQVDQDITYDRYKGVSELMPYAKAVSAKTYSFDSEGNEESIDYYRMMEIVTNAGYHSYVGIEYEGQGLSEPEGIRATKALLVKVRDSLDRQAEM